MSSPPETALQAFELSGLVELFDLDLSTIAGGAPTLHFTSALEEPDSLGMVVRRGSVDYTPVPLKLTGFGRGGDGAPKQPTLAVGNVHHTLTPWVWPGQDLVGAHLTRTVVLAQWLDGHSDVDSSRYVHLDAWTVEQKLKQTPEGIEFRLVSRFDQGGKKLPGRQMLRDTCLLRYREWNGATFDQFSCPYTDSNYFDRLGASTTAANDQCSKKFLTGCKPRFGSTDLPMLAFPGLGRRR